MMSLSGMKFSLHAEVADLAAGGSPIASLTDEDGDGFVDVWENKYAGNLTDLGAGVYSQNLHWS